MPDVPEALRAELGRSPVRIVMVARFQEPKDHRTLLAALAQMREEAWTLDLIGDGPLEANVRRLADELGLIERVRFLGQRNDVDEQLAEAQLFLLISRWEGFPLSILEAMRAGLPVIASNVGGCNESVVDGETGFLVRSGDVGSLHDKLMVLVRSAVLRQQMGTAGRKRFTEHFTFHQMFEKTFALYGQVRGGVFFQQGLPGSSDVVEQE
jgi:glycosyltransferase involved in cell wall biosynthesis